MVREHDAMSPSLSAGALSLHVEASTGPLDSQRRVEDWIVSHLDNSAASSGDSGSAGNLPDLSMFRKTGGPSSPADPKVQKAHGWTRLRINRRQGILIAKLVDATLVKESDLRDLADELGALLDAWQHRIVLNFANVERLSSSIVGAVLKTHRRCEARDGGKLKLCGLRPEVARVFALAGLKDRLQIEPDEASALDGPWPETRFPRPLPISILSALSGRPAPALLPTPSAEPDPLKPGEDAPMVLDVQRTAQVRLVAESGRACGQVVLVTEFPFRIGRSEVCHLRCDSQTISRIHAVIKMQGDRVLLRDLATTNGTGLNDQVLKGTEAVIVDGDRVEIGPLRFRVDVGDPLVQVEHLIDDWLLSDDPASSTSPTISDDKDDPMINGQPLKTEVIQGVLVISPTIGELADEATIEALRAALDRLADHKRVVVNLDLVVTLSSRAIGLLVAHALRLERAGGALRISQAPARIRMILEQVRLTMLVTLYPTVDDAVLATWP